MNKNKMVNRFCDAIEVFFKKMDLSYGRLGFPVLYVFAIAGFFMAAIISSKYYTDDTKSLSFVIGPIILGLIAFLVGENSRENEIIKLREKWLSEIKHIMSRYMAKSDSFYRLVITMAKSKKISLELEEVSPECFRNSAMSDEIHKLFSSLAEDKSFLIYSLSGTGEEEGKIKDCIDRVHKKLSILANKSDAGEMSAQNFYEHRKEFRERLSSKLVVCSDDYFKEEWIRIKRGGLGIRLKRLVCFFVICVLVGVYVGSLWVRINFGSEYVGDDGSVTSCITMMHKCSGFYIFDYSSS